MHPLETGHTRTARVSVVGAAVAACVAWAYYPTFLTLTDYWAENDFYSFAFLVPLISGYMVWELRGAWRRVPASPSLWLGSGALAAGLGMLVVGRLSSINLLEDVSFVVTVSGLALLFLGRAVCRVIAFPLAFLVAMVPFWDFFTQELHWPFQLYSAIIGVESLKTLGIPVLREGIFIHLPNVTLEVAEACSGVNNLIAVVCLGLPLAYLQIRSWPRRIFVVASAVLIALLSNAIRVALVSLFAYYGIRGADGDIHGPFSLLRSFVISGVGFVVLFWLIAKLADRHHDAGSSAPVTPGSPSLTLRTAPAVVALAMLVTTLGFFGWHHVQPVPPSVDFFLLPEQIDGWQAARRASFGAPLTSAEFDHSVSRGYTAADGSEVNVFVGYFEAQEQGRELAGFAIRGALAGEHDGQYALADGTGISEFTRRVGTTSFHVSYWYDLDGRITSTHSGAKLLTTWQSIVHRRTDGALVVVTLKMQPEEPVEASRLRATAFIKAYLHHTGRTRD